MRDSLEKVKRSTSDVSVVTIWSHPDVVLIVLNTMESTVVSARTLVYVLVTSAERSFALSARIILD